MERSQDLTMWSGSGAEGDALAFKKRLGKRASGIAFGEDRLQTPVAVVTIGARKPPLIVGGLPPAGVSKRSPPRSPHVITLRPMSDSAPLYLDSAPPKFKMSATRAGSGAAVLARPRRRRRRRVRMPEVADPVNVQSSSSSSSSSSCSCPGSCACSPKRIRSLNISVFFCWRVILTHCLWRGTDISPGLAQGPGAACAHRHHGTSPDKPHGHWKSHAGRHALPRALR